MEVIQQTKPDYKGSLRFWEQNKDWKNNNNLRGNAYGTNVSSADSYIRQTLKKVTHKFSFPLKHIAVVNGIS